jgi:diadenosine tetraphosphate (Ap4A) HIT family hydrolase
VVGDHQYFPGYCLLIYKNHIRELHELTPVLQDELNRELMQATHAVVKAFQPWKINHACLGNTDEHIHWHIIPRYLNDPDHKNQPWLHAGDFHKHKVGITKQQEIAALIRKNL